MNRPINQIAVLGSGVMGSRIACLFAGAGIQVRLLDMAYTEGTESQRNKLVNEALQAALKSNPSPVYTKADSHLIRTGNFEDNFKDIGDCDWVIEVVVERLDIKKAILEKVDQFRRPGSLITSNTSGIPIHLMSADRSEDFQRHFCGTHFFNPPRYLRLLEIIPAPQTDPQVIDFLMEFGSKMLGKTTVLCKDSPAFIANRIGVFSLMQIFRLMETQQLSIDEIERLTGTIIGRPKSATFRTADVVGIDTLVKVADGIYENCPDDESREMFRVPDWLRKMVQENRLGEKTGQGFFKKIKGKDGSSEILTLDLKTFEYVPRQKVSFAAITAAKPIEDLRQRLKMLYQADDRAGKFYRAFHQGLFAYVSHRIGQISDSIYQVDDAMKAGFGWEIGPFESWDLLGPQSTTAAMETAGQAPAAWVSDMLKSGKTQFYQLEGGVQQVYDKEDHVYQTIPGQAAFLVLRNFKDKLVWHNNSCRLYDIGDEVLGLEWQTKMGTIGGDVLSGIQTAITTAEKNYKGLVIANEGLNFSAGANIGMIFMLAVEQEYEELDMAVRAFQDTMMRVRYSAIPVVVAPHGLALGGGCELSLHADKICAAAETYTGLVELGVGVIPGGGGTKEFVLRASDSFQKDIPENIPLQQRFLTIATAKVSTSAQEAFELGYYRPGRDEVVMHPDRRIARAKKSVLDLFDRGYQQPVQRNDIKVLGRSALGALLSGIHGMEQARYATAHDALVARKLAAVMCGGDLSAPQLVSERYLLDLERQAFLSLCGEKKTLERLQSVITKGKPIRN